MDVYRIFVLDDVRGPRQLFTDAWETPESALIPWGPHAGKAGAVSFAWSQRYMPAIEVVRGSATFDAWTIDHDLQDSDGTGLDFLRFMFDRHPHKCPDVILCHSGHPRHAREMYALVDAFQKGRVDKTPA